MSKTPLEMLDAVKKFVLNLSDEKVEETPTVEVKTEEVSESVEVKDEVEVKEEIEVKNEEPQFVTTADFETAMNDLKSRSEERRVGKECRYRWSPYH